MRAHVRSDALDRPGVYRMLSADGEIIYVGKSKRVRSRLLSYFRCAFPEEKGARLIREAARLEWEYAPSEFAALLQEMRLIKRYRPRFNVMLKRDARHLAFVKLTRGPASRLAVVRGASDDSSTYFGPFHGARRVADALRELSDALGLRDCRMDSGMRFADQAELFQLERTPGCIRYEVRKCLGPCIAGCTESQYTERVVMARDFLDGLDDAPMDLLRRQMDELSDQLQYERAAVLRDKLSRLEELRAQFHRLRFAVETLSFLYPVPGHGGDDRVYLIRRGRVRAERAKPRTAAERRALRELEAGVFGGSEPTSAQVPTHEVDELMLLSYWFRKFPEELRRTRRSRFTDGTLQRTPKSLTVDLAS
jgi:excinuclease ABC subunit C